MQAEALQLRAANLAESVGRSLTVYTRNEDTGALTEQREIPLGTGLDNIEVDGQGNLWIGSHPKLLDFAAHAKDKSGAKRAPSQVLRLKPSGDAMESEEVFLDDGRQMSASSVAAVSVKWLLVGSVFDKEMLRCELP